MMMLDDWHERAAVMHFDGKQPTYMADRKAWSDVMVGEIPHDINQVVFAASPADDESIAAAKEWVRERGYTGEDVSLKKSQTCVYVVVKNGIK